MTKPDDVCDVCGRPMDEDAGICTMFTMMPGGEASAQLRHAACDEWLKKLAERERHPRVFLVMLDDDDEPRICEARA